jgi:hypothetical protein
VRAIALGAVALAGTGTAVALAEGTSAGSAGSGMSTSSSSASTTPASLPPAPAGFASSIVKIYSEQYQAATALDSASPELSSQQLPAPSSFAQSVANLTPQELAALYAASQQVPDWGQLGGALATLDAQAKQYASSATVHGAWRQAARAAATLRHATATRAGAIRRVKPAGASGFKVRSALAPGTATNGFPPIPPTTTIPAPPGTFVPSQAVGATQAVTCPPGAPGGPTIAPGDDGIYAAQLTSDIATNLAADLDPTITVAGFSIPDPAKYVAEAIALAGQVTLDTLNFYQQVFADCDTADRDLFLANIDNTTQQLYALESQYIQPTVDSIQSSLGTIHDQVAAVQQGVEEQLTIDIEQALSASPSTSTNAPPPNIEFMLPASDGGNLNSTPVGVQEVVSTALSQAQAAGLPENAMVARQIAAANAALAAGQYRTAFDDYQAAYQALG